MIIVGLWGLYAMLAVCYIGCVHRWGGGGFVLGVGTFRGWGLCGEANWGWVGWGEGRRWGLEVGMGV